MPSGRGSGPTGVLQKGTGIGSNLGPVLVLQKNLHTGRDSLTSEWFSDVNNGLVSGISRESSSNLP